MPGVLTRKDTKLLDRLTASKASVHDAVTVIELLDIIKRQQDGLRAADFKHAAITVAAHGIVSAADIASRGLPDDLRDECLHLRQQYDDAKAYCDQQVRSHSPIEQATTPEYGLQPL